MKFSTTSNFKKSTVNNDTKAYYRDFRNLYLNCMYGILALRSLSPTSKKIKIFVKKKDLGDIISKISIKK